ncbi:hypothetical protein O23A_p2857 [Aeromonas salmonicida]|nr:hypothetical protein O23A_p2857 [Aeromonas salmonicida]
MAVLLKNDFQREFHYVSPACQRCQPTQFKTSKNAFSC